MHFRFFYEFRQIAARRAIRPDERPAPLYLRAPDATPSSAPIPSILP